MIFLSIVGYLIGSIPFGLLLTRLAGLGDIRKIGSGNIGATNVLRTGNKKLAALTLFLDGGKGAVVVLIVQALAGHEYAMIAGGMAVIGHMFPVWLRFRGGKGVATTLGMLLALVPLVGAVSCGLWLVTAFAFRYSSLAALVAIAAAPLVAHVIYADSLLDVICGGVAALVWLKHRANIKRLVNGEEPKIGKKKQ